MASTLVVKFGGTSVADVEARRRAIERIAERHEAGFRLVVVVSAMGRAGAPYATDTLLTLAAAGGPGVSPRETDAVVACGEDLAAAVLAAQLVASGLPAVSVRGSQAGIWTDGTFQAARITHIDCAPIERHLAQGKVVVVPGFQGVGPDGAITTLGRGGSDTTAVAVGAALKAEAVEIFTDVDGVFSADPRVVPDARLIPVLPYQEAGDLTQHGARVLHPRAAEIAARHGIEVRILNTFSKSAGTRIGGHRAGEPCLERPIEVLATAVTSTGPLCQATVHGADFATEPERAAGVFGEIAGRSVSLDLINVLPDRLAFTFAERDRPQVAEAVTGLGLAADFREPCVKVTVVGGGIHGVPGVMARITRTLADARIPILQSVDSHTIISVLVAGAHEALAVRLLHDAFQLGAGGQRS